MKLEKIGKLTLAVACFGRLNLHRVTARRSLDCNLFKRFICVTLLSSLSWRRLLGSNQEQLYIASSVEEAQLPLQH